MQTVRNGNFAEIEEFSPEALTMKFKERNVDHVEVFPGTKKNIKTRTARIGKKYQPSKGFKKAPTNKKK
ncbi:MAG: hypothetical protein CL528_11425 [Aequorivita sp.]|nr:hypothetical protein [Aequorivita sp.]MBP42377.1 hypothetical protein [Aequorivita sp.]|tara:strand:- start:3053 stop:3259 length:207 start_codon:yes stop_codon:yes gene_type:complete